MGMSVGHIEDAYHKDEAFHDGFFFILQADDTLYSNKGQHSKVQYSSHTVSHRACHPHFYEWRVWILCVLVLCAGVYTEEITIRNNNASHSLS